MTEDPSQSRKHQFLSKTKWAKVFKPTDDQKASDSKQKSNFNEDVVDFLRPSTEKYSGLGTGARTTPKLDTTSALRWPDASDIRAANASKQTTVVPSPLPVAANGKSKRRKNLTVRFLTTAPEVIGHGGDETETPSIEIAQRKKERVQATQRSVSDTRPSIPQHTEVGLGIDQYARPGMRERSKTDFGYDPQVTARTFEASVDRNYLEGQSTMPRPGMMKRAPTGMMTEEENADQSSLHDSPEIHSLDGAFPTIHIQKIPNRSIHGDTGSQSTDERLLGAQSRVKKQMREEEGRTFSTNWRLSQQGLSLADSPAIPESKFNAQLPPQQAHLQPSPPSIRVEPQSEPQRRPQNAHRSNRSVSYDHPPPQPPPHQELKPGPTSGRPRSMFLDSPTNAKNYGLLTPDGEPGSANARIFSFEPGSQDRINNSIENTMRVPATSNANTRIFSFEPGAEDQVTPSLDGMMSSYHPPRSPRNIARPPPSPIVSREPSPSYFNPQRSTSANQSIDLKASNQSPVVGCTPSAPPSPDPGSEVNKAAAFDEFASRVVHMKGVFSLIAQKEADGTEVSHKHWLRCAFWWFHRGKSGCETYARKQARSPGRSMLAQCHVDVAKAWWILTQVVGSAPNTKQDESTAGILKYHMQNLTLWMDRRNILPPHQSMIQGQDTTIWIRYPRFSPDLDYMMKASTPTMEPAYLLPAGDSRLSFFYSRMFVSASVNTDDPNTDRVNLPCILSIIRGVNHYQTTLVIASQNEQVNVVVSPESDKSKYRGPSWGDVSWKNQACGMYIQLMHGFVLNVSLEEHDYKALQNMVEYTRKMDRAFVTQEGENIIYRAQLADASYTDSMNPHAFATEKIRGCHVCILESNEKQSHGVFSRNIHLGYRILLVTPTTSRTLSSISLDFGKTSSFLFDIPEAEPQLPILQLHAGSHDHRKRMLLGFQDQSQRTGLLDVLHGTRLSDDEAILCRLVLREFASQHVETNSGTVAPSHNVMHGLKWQTVSVVNRDQREPLTVLSDSLRVVVHHAGGVFNDRLNLRPGELFLRLPVTSEPHLQLLRAPQNDLTMTVDARQVSRDASSQLLEVQNIFENKVNVRSYVFNSLTDLHNFQRAITGCEVRFDAISSLFSITRRRMVVSIQKKLDASRVRVQVVRQGGNTQVMAFFEDFPYADAMVFAVKGSDEFERIKPDKTGKHCVRLIEAKFSLPKKEKYEQDDHGHDYKFSPAVRRKFVNLEGLDYAEEHDDIVIGFDSEQDCTRFCEALPGSVHSGRGFTLMRRI
ncbi:hypothetical protein MBLNU457_3167t2 [Dothideomycetes sp. NU457]